MENSTSTRNPRISDEQMAPAATASLVDSTARTALKPFSPSNYPYGLRRVHDDSAQRRLTDNTGGGETARADPTSTGWGVLSRRPAADTKELRGSSMVAGKNPVISQFPNDSGDLLNDFDFDAFLRE